MAPTAAGIRAGQAYVEISGEDGKLREACKRSEQYLRDLGQATREVNGASGGFFEQLAARARSTRLEARKSGETALERALASGGGLTTFGLRALGVGLPAMIMQEAGAGLAEMTKKAIELRKEFQEGKKSAGQMADELAAGVPILGNFWQTGRNLRELFTGEAAAVAEIRKEADLISKSMYAARDATKAYHEALKDVKATAEEIANRRELIGKTPDEQARIIAQQDYDKQIKAIAKTREEKQAEINRGAAKADAEDNERRRSAEKRLEEMARKGPSSRMYVARTNDGTTHWVRPEDAEAARAAVKTINEIESMKQSRAELTRRRLEELDADTNQNMVDRASERDEKIRELDERNLLEHAKREEELSIEEGRLMNERNAAKWKAEEDHQKEIIGYMEESDRAMMEHHNAQIDAQENLAVEIERQQITLGKRGLDQRLALLEVERREALRRAKEQGLDLAGGINTKFDLMRQIELSRGIGATGTFSAAQAAQLGGGVELKEQTKVLRNIEKNTRDIKGPTFR